MSEHPPVVYISGPMTGYEDFNRQAFYDAEAHLFEMGYATINPARLDDGEDTTGWQHHHYMRRDLELLLAADLIYLLPGWRWSKGASLEARVAEGCGISTLEDSTVEGQEKWRTFEGEPEDGEARFRGVEFHTVTAHDGAKVAEVVVDDTVAKAEEDAAAAADPCSESPVGHPRFGDIDPEPDEAQPVRLHTVEPNNVAAPLFADLDIEVDDSLPKDTLRMVTPVGVLDFEVTWSNGQMHLARKPTNALAETHLGVEDYHLHHLAKPRPGDEFPNVGYVRRMRALMDRALNRGERRSA